MIALAFPMLVQAETTDVETATPKLTVYGRAAGSATEGTGSYATGAAKTATPLSLSLRDTPQSVSVVTQQRIEDQNLQTITDVLNNVTGVSVNQYETHRAQFTARGFDINALMIDGVPTTWQQSWSSGEAMTSLAIYDRVEVVRGATGMTTGAGDPAGAVNLVRKRASSNEFKGFAEVAVGSWDALRATVDVASPLNESKTLRVRAIGEYSGSDSWIDLVKERRQTLFLTAEADLSDRTLLTVGVSRQQNDPKGSMWGGLPVWYSDGSRATWDRSKTTSADWTRWNSAYTNTFASLEHRFDNNWSVKGSYSHGDREADSYLLYVYGAPDRTTGLGMYTWPGAYKVRTKQDDAALTASGPFELFGRRHEAAVGYVYSKQDFHADSRSAAGGLAPDFNNWTGAIAEPAWGPLSYYGKGTTTQQAVYGAASISVADPLKLIVGLRVNRYERSGDEGGGAAYDMSFDSELTPYAGVVYDLSANTSLYASYTSIFQPQAKRDINGKYLDPILGKSTEIGVKSEFFDGRLNASAALFQIKQDNLAQSTGELIPGTTPPETAYRASEGATSKGFELELSGELARGWNASAGYTQFTLKDASGADINTIYPRKLFRVFTSYRLPGALAGLTVGGGVNWQGETYTYATNPLGVTDKIDQKAYALVNLMARYDITKQWSAQLNVNNLFDKTYYGMFDAYSQFTYGAPRNASLSATYRF